MILHVMAIRDASSDSFGNPMFFLTPGQALRSVTDEVNRSADDNMLYKHSNDFELFNLGTFDTNTAQFSLLPAPSSLALCRNLKLNGSS